MANTKGKIIIASGIVLVAGVTTAIIISHNRGLLDKCCTHMLHIENYKLHLHKGNLSEFTKINPKAASYFEAAGIAVNYENRKNILAQKHIRQLLQVLRFLNHLANNQIEHANQFLVNFAL